MKNINQFYTALFILTLAISFIACKGHSTSDHQTHTIEMGPTYSSKYVCPMHCEGSGSAVAGDCNVCGMAYIENKSHAHYGHNH